MEDILKEVLKYWKVIKRRWLLSIIVSMLAATFGIAYVFTLPYKYKADSTVFIENNLINSLVEGIAVTHDSESKIRVLRFAMLSRSMIGNVINKIDPVLLPEDIGDGQDFISSLQRRTHIRIRGGDLFTVSIEDASPVFARDYINTLVNTYVEESIEQTRSETYGANRFLDEQVRLYKKKLDQAEDAIIEFRKKHGVYVAVSEDGILQEVRTLQENIEALDIDIESFLAKKNEINRQLARVSPTISITSSTGDSSGRAIQIQQQINQLRTVYTDDYPEIIRLKIEMKALQDQPLSTGQARETSTLRSANPVYQSLSQQRAEIDGEISGLKAKKSKLLQMIDNRQEELRFIPDNQKKLASLEKDKASLQAIYTDLLGRMSQAEMSKQMEIGNKTTTFRIVDPAILPNKHSSPDIPFMLLAAIAASFGVGLIAAVVWEALDTTVKNVDGLPLEEIPELPVIGMISQIPLAADMARARKHAFFAYSAAGVYYTMAFGLLLYMKFIK